MSLKRFIATFPVVGVILFLGATQVAAKTHVELTQLLSPRLAKQFPETVEWQRYEATRINIGTSQAWEVPAIFLDLKGDDWKVAFPNNRFLSPDLFFFGDITNPRTVKSDIKKAALELLERNLVLVYRVRVGESGPLDRAIVLTPYTITGSSFGNTIRLKLDNNAIWSRERHHH